MGSTLMGQGKTLSTLSNGFLSTRLGQSRVGSVDGQDGAALIGHLELASVIAPLP